MTNQAITIHRPTVDLMAADSQTEIKAMAYKIVKFGGVKTNEDAVALAVYSWMTDLNPFNQECYWMPGVGPTPGVQGYRRKAKEYNRVMGGDDDWDYKVNYRLAQPHEADFDPDAGDVAWVCELTDTKAEKEWQGVYVEMFNMLTEKGADYKFADERAMMIAGPRPVWDAVGVVKASERFSKQEYENNKVKVDENGDPVYKAEMWDRNERAKKRAEKGALKKRYPDLLIPDLHEVYDSNIGTVIKDVTNVIDGEVIESRATFDAMTPEEHTQAAEAILGDLGFSEAGADQSEPPAQPDPIWSNDNAADIYATVLDSKGKLYSEKEIGALQHIITALNKKIKDLGEPQDEEQVKILDDIKLKRDAAFYYRDKINEGVK